MALINCPECNREISDKAGACPNCGLPLEKERISKPVYSPPNSYKKVCPTCGSENIQTIKMMCMAGTSSGSAIGGGVSTDLDLGVGKMDINTRSALAEKYTPGTSPHVTGKGCGCASLLVGLFFLLVYASSATEEGSGFGLFLASVGFLVGIFLLARGKDNPQQKEWEAKVKLYENGWICHQCGKTWRH